MRIAQLANKYGIEKRTIDYYTNLKLIPCTTEEGSTYRDYGEDAESVVKKILILRDVGMSEKKIKEALSNPSYFTTAMWNEHIATLQTKIAETQKHYEEMIQFAKDLRDTNSLALRFPKLIDPNVAHLASRIWGKMFSYFDEEKLLSLSETLPEDISRISNDVYTFVKSMERKSKEGIEPSSPEVQSIVTRLFNSIKEYYGLGAYLLFLMFKDEDAQFFGIDTANEEDVETFIWIKQAFNICADWCREARTIENIKMFNEFHQKYEERIRKLDEALKDSSFDFLTQILSEICSIPSQISKETLDQMETSFYYGCDLGAEKAKDQAAKEGKTIDVEKADKLEKFVVQAIKYYFSSRQIPQNPSIDINHSKE